MSQVVFHYELCSLSAQRLFTLYITLKTLLSAISIIILLVIGRHTYVGKSTTHAVRILTTFTFKEWLYICTFFSLK